ALEFFERNVILSRGDGEGPRRLRSFAALRMTSHVLLPVPPAPDELAIVAIVGNDVARDREQYRGLTPRPRREPMIGVGCGVGETHVEDDQLRAARLALHHALRVRIEVVTRFEMRADEEDDVGLGVVGTGPVPSHPELISG